MNGAKSKLKRNLERAMKAWKPAIILMILTTPLLSCRSLPERENIINRPIVPDSVSNGVSVVSFDENTDMVSMPLWYWKKIVRYIASSEAAFDTLEISE